MPPSTAHRSIAAALTAALTAGEALAQEAPVELARLALIREAEEAARRGDHATAIARARRAAELRATPSISHFLAREHEALGQPLEALAQASACERGAEADRGLHNRDALLRACRAISASVAARVGRVVVRVDEPAPPGLSVRVAGAPLPDALRGIPYPVAPGVVRVEAEAPGHEPLRREVSVDAGHDEEVRVSLAALSPGSARAAVTPAPSPIALAPARRPVMADAPQPSRARWIAVGVGLSALVVGGLAASGATYAIALDARDARDLACASPCAEGAPGHDTAVGHDARYRDHLQAATWSLVAGGALAAGAALWWALARPASRAISPAVAALPGGARVGFTASW